MKPLTTSLLVACFLIPASVVLSQGRSSADFLFRENAIRIDGCLFDKAPSVPGDEWIRGEALSLIRRGGKSATRAFLPLDRKYPALPNGLRAVHGMKFETSGVTNEVRTGMFTAPRAKNLFSPSSGWEYHETGSGAALGMAIRNQGGRKSIVLIDRARKTFLSISN